MRYSRLPDLQAIGVETHGVEAQFGQLLNAALPSAWDVDVPPGSRDLRLKAGVPEIDGGAILPNLNDPFVSDGHPDLGAFEFGQPLPEYGPRLLTPDLRLSSKGVSLPLATPGQTLTYTIVLRNAGSPAVGIHMTDTLPDEVNYLGNLTASAGNASFSNGTVSWVGDVTQASQVTVTFDVALDAQVTSPQLVTNTALIEDGSGGVLQRQASFIANGVALYLPLSAR